MSAPDYKAMYAPFAGRIIGYPTRRFGGGEMTRWGRVERFHFNPIQRRLILHTRDINDPTSPGHCVPVDIVHTVMPSSY